MKIYFTSNLEFLKALHGLTNKKIGDDTGIGQTFNNYISGRHEPSLANLVALSQYFKINIDDLLLKDLKEEGLRNLVEDRHEEYGLKDRLQQMEKQIKSLQALVKNKRK
jgi:transcriptional regulator with XRE-family HTH domain